MSRKASRKSSLKTRSKMDRYTEDLKYSLRRSLAESVDRVSLRADDILARGHRQIVADFTDPRQWYYSATHDYIIQMLRESQRQNGNTLMLSGAGRQGIGSRHQDSRRLRTSTISMGRSNSSRGSDLCVAGENPNRKRESLIRISTETSQEVAEIRRNISRKRDDKLTTESHFKQDKEEGGRHNLSPNKDSSHQSARSDNRLVDKYRTSTENERKVLGTNSDSGAAGEHDHVQNGRGESPRNGTVIIENNSRNEADESVESVAESSTPAMESYRASKQSRHNSLPNNSAKQPPTAVAASTALPPKDIDYFVPLPDISEPFIPLEKRNKRVGRDTRDVCLPSIGHLPYASSAITDQAMVPNVHGNPVGKGWKRKAGPKSTLDPMFGEKPDPKYVEDWVRKLEVKSIAQPAGISNHSNNSPRQDIIARSTSSPLHGRNPNHSDEYKKAHSMSLPNDFQPLSSFQSFHPMTSLYIYSMKQKSELNVKFKHFQIPRPLRPSNTFKDDLHQARSRVDFIEGKLGELYQTERNLTKVVDRKVTLSTPLKLKDIAINAKPVSPTRRGNSQSFHPTDAKKTYVGDQVLDDDQVLQRKVDSDVAATVDTTCLSQSNTSSKVSVVSLSLPEVASDNRDVGQAEVVEDSPGTSSQSLSTSAWKQSTISYDRSKDVKVLEGKTIRVFDSGMPNSKAATTSNRPLIRYDINGSAKQRDTTKSPAPSGLEISDVALKVIHDLLDQLDSSDDFNEKAISLEVSESQSLRDGPHETANTAMVEKSTRPTTTEDPTRNHRIAKCPFCKVPSHEHIEYQDKKNP